MQRLHVTGLPDDPLAAAALFYSDFLPHLPASGSTDMVLIFAPADHTHTAWRLAAVQGLARDRAPERVNALAGSDEAMIAAGVAYLATAPGVTGQYLPLDGCGAGPVIPILP